MNWPEAAVLITVIFIISYQIDKWLARRKETQEAFLSLEEKYPFHNCPTGTIHHVHEGAKPSNVHVHDA